MNIESTQTYVVKIYTSGPVDLITNICREYCRDVGLCVTVTETLFVYTGGEERGVEIGLLGYPRFPVNDFGEINDTARYLAKTILERAFQDSILIVMPDVSERITAEVV